MQCYSGDLFELIQKYFLLAKKLSGKLFQIIIIMTVWGWINPFGLSLSIHVDIKMSSRSRQVKANVMSNVGSVQKGSTAAHVQSSVDKGQGAPSGLSKGMSAEGHNTGGQYSGPTSNAQSTVDKAYR